jgi:response regulator RpfG family c-di-GMP phosphodiesterase
VPLEDGERSLTGIALSWTPAAFDPGTSAGQMWGTLILPDGEHIAAAVKVEGGDGYVAVHRPIADLMQTHPGLMRSIAGVSAVVFAWAALFLGLAVYIILARQYDRVDAERSKAAENALRQTRSLVRTRDAVIMGLAKLAESRDPETGDHLERISAYSTMLASYLRGHPRFSDEITPSFVKLIGISSALHDIGKVGVADSILRKPGPLTPAERKTMECHAVVGGQCLEQLERRLGSSNFLAMARQIAYSHHERWDGTGYPYRLEGNAIPLAARIVTVVDVYDALSQKRVYKDPVPHDDCVANIREQAGKQFDPDIVEAFLKVAAKFRAVARRYELTTQEAADNAPPQEEELAVCAVGAAAGDE